MVAEIPAEIPASIPVEFGERMAYTLADAGFVRPVIGVAVEFESHIDAGRMSRAVRLLADLEPVLGCRFVAAAVPPVWERVEDLDDLTLTDIRDSSNLASDAASFVTEPLNPVIGPQIRAAVLRGPSRDAVVLAISTLTADGAALKRAVQLLGGIYTRLEREPDWHPPVDTEGVRSMEPAVKETRILDRFKALRPQDLFPSTEWGIRGTHKHGMPVYVWRNVEPARFCRLVQYGRVHGVGVDEMLLAAYYRALYAALKPALNAKTPVQVSCDLRSVLPAGARPGLANLSATWSATIALDRDEPFSETLQSVGEQIAEWKQSGWISATAVSMVLADRLNRKKGLEADLKQSDVAGEKLGHGRGYPALVNVGTIEAEAVDYGPQVHVTSAYTFGPLGFPGGFVLMASTFKDCLRLSAGIDRESTDIKLAQAIVDGTARELEGAVA